MSKEKNGYSGVVKYRIEGASTDSEAKIGKALQEGIALDPGGHFKVKGKKLVDFALEFVVENEEMVLNHLLASKTKDAALTTAKVVQPEPESAGMDLFADE